MRWGESGVQVLRCSSSCEQRGNHEHPSPGRAELPTPLRFSLFCRPLQLQVRVAGIKPKLVLAAHDKELDTPQQTTGARMRLLAGALGRAGTHTRTHTLLINPTMNTVHSLYTTEPNKPACEVPHAHAQRRSHERDRMRSAAAVPVQKATTAHTCLCPPLPLRIPFASPIYRP